MRRRYGGYNGRKRYGSPKSALLSVLFWAVSGFIMIGLIHGGPAKAVESKSEDVAKMYIGNIFPTVSRSADFESRPALSNSVDQTAEKKDGLLDEKQSKGFFNSMMGSMFPAAEVLNDDLAEEDPGIVYSPEDVAKETELENKEDSASQGASDSDLENVASTDPSKIDYSKPLVIIYHTHATESYMPVSDGNFHSLKAYGTVREVGDELTKQLEANGIQVIHDKTINDSPSYNQSYTRSLETIKKLIAENKKDSLMIVIDLHRDAAAYTGNVGKTVDVKNDTVAKYNLVVGMGNPNVEALKSFGDQVNKTAEAMYPGFGGTIIPKQYKFNQYVSDHHMLLEIGNNMNTIDQAKLTGKYFANVLTKVIKDMQ
jgi:stage II sporulation protein P